MIRSAALVSALLATLAAASAVQAQENAFDPYGRDLREREIRTERRGPTEYQTVAPLAKLRAQPGPIVLRGAHAFDRVAFPLAPNVRVTGATLRLLHNSSLGLLEAPSHLKITQNDLTIAQIPAAQQPVSSATEIDLDPLAFLGGYNRVGFEAVQRYTYDCQTLDAPELWTEIDALRSELSLVYERERFDERLSDLDRIFSPGIGGLRRLSIVTGTAEPTTAQAKWGALAAQAMAVRMGYRLPEIKHRVAEPTDQAPVQPSPVGKLARTGPPDNDMIVVGTLEELAPVLTLSEQEIDTAYLEIGPSPEDPTRFVIVATGPTEADVQRAVTALGLMNFPFADSRTAKIPEIDLAEGLPAAQRPALQPGAVYDFRDLGFQDTTVRGDGTHRLEVNFDLPAGLYLPEDADARLWLDFAYGAGLQERSVINVSVNGTFYEAIPLEAAEGALVPGYMLDLPARAFRGGGNTLEIDVEMAGAAGESCAQHTDGNLIFSLQDSSRFAFPPADRYAALPDFRLFGRAGFPYLDQDDPSYAVRLTDRSGETLAAAWTVLARLSQIDGSLSLDAHFTFGDDTEGRHTLVFGPADTLPEELRGSGELTVGQPGTTASGVPQGDRGRTPRPASDSRPGYWGQLMRDLGLGAPGEPRPLPDRAATRIVQITDLGRNGLLLGREDAEQPDRLVSIVTSSSAPRLLTNVRELVEPEVWSQLSGSAVIWRPGRDSVATQAAEAGFYVGELGGARELGFFASSYPRIWIAVVLGVLLVFGLVLWLTIALLRRRRAEAEE
jgi:hypothetical protein